MKRDSAARARLKVRWMDRTAAIMPWLALFSGLGINVTAETLTGPEPE